MPNTTCNHDLRPCIVDKKKKGFFHCWEEERKPVGAAVTIGGPPAGQLAYTLGIVELEDGSVIECFPCRICFLDRDSTDTPKKGVTKSTHPMKPRWAPESEIDEACRWITETVKPSKWPCGSDGEKACDDLCKQCWKKWKSQKAEVG